MSEISIVASRKVRLQQRAEEGDHRAALALLDNEQPTAFGKLVMIHPPFVPSVGMHALKVVFKLPGTRALVLGLGIILLCYVALRLVAPHFVVGPVLARRAGPIAERFAHHAGELTGGC